MSRRFKPVDYEATLHTTVRLGDCLPADHLARFVADIVAHLDLAALYARYGTRGGEPYAPEILLGLLFYGYATGVFASRKIEQGTKETAALRFLAGHLSPDHDTIAHFRRTFLPELKGLFVQILLLAREAGFLELGNISLDGTKVHADASKSKAVSYKRFTEIEARLSAEIEELFALAEKADQKNSHVPEGMDLPAEIARREDRLRRLAEAKAVLEARAKERFIAEQAQFDAEQRERQAQEQRTGKKPRGRPPQPPTVGPKDTDQFNFTDPDSRIMKNSQNEGFDQRYNAQVAVDQATLLVVGCSVSNHPSDHAEVAPTLSSIPAALGTPGAAALDTGYFSEANVRLLEEVGVDPYIATGRASHHGGWRGFFEEAGLPPPDGATLREQMAHKLRTTAGKTIYRRRKCSVEPAIGQIKEAMGFRQFSLRGLSKVAGEWCLVCLSFNLRRFHTMAFS